MTNMYLQPNANLYVDGQTYLLAPDGAAYVGQYANGCISGCGSSRDGGDGGFPQSQYWNDVDSRFRTQCGRKLESTRSEEHTSELQSLMRISYAVFCLKKKNNTQQNNTN